MPKTFGPKIRTPLAPSQGKPAQLSSFLPFAGNSLGPASGWLSTLPSVPCQPLHLGLLPGCPLLSPCLGPISDSSGCLLQKPSLIRCAAGHPPSTLSVGIYVFSIYRDQDFEVCSPQTNLSSGKVKSFSTQSPGTPDTSSLPSPPAANDQVFPPFP